jgi:menaquinol-cytochrome c reductase cytochrome b/c subunit
VNRAQQKEYLEDYAEAKRQGKPFFPYAIYKDHLVALLAIGIVIFMAIAYKVEVGEPVNPASSDYVPRPEWYFFFLFELLKIFKGQNIFSPVIMGTFLVPNVLMVLLIALPFIDRGPERRIEKRPIALATAIMVVAGLAWLTHEGANSPSGTVDPAAVELEGLDEAGQAGLELYAANGCASCHMIKGEGAPGPGPDLTNQASKDRGIEWQIEHLKEPTSRTPGSSMPAFPNFTDQEYQDLATFLEGLGDTYK